MRARVTHDSRTLDHRSTRPSRASKFDNCKKSCKNCLVIGAGPAGSLAACYLAQEGYSVDVYEAKPRPVPRIAETVRSYPIVIGSRAMQAIREVVEVPDREVFAYKGYNVLAGGNGDQKITYPASKDLVLLSRTELSYHLICQAEKHFPGAIHFTFEAPCLGVDLANQSVTLSTRENGRVQQHYDLLVGADGGGSVVRQAMMEMYGPGMTAKVLDSPHARMDYKTFHHLPANLAPPLLQDSQPGKPGRWLYEVRTPRPGASLSFWPRHDGSYSGIMRATKEVYAELVSMEDYRKLVQGSMKDLPQEWADSISQQLVDTTINHFHPGMIISRCVGPHVVILGDAAHPITPAAGQGANAALDDCRLLAKALERYPHSLQQGLEEFQARKLPESHALVLMDNLFDWSAMGPKVASALSFAGKLHFRICQYQAKCHWTLSSVLQHVLSERWLHAVRRPMNATT